MSIGQVGTGSAPQTDLTQQLLGGQMAEVEQQMKTAKVAAQMQVKGQAMEQQQAAVAMLTGVGGNLNTVA